MPRLSLSAALFLLVGFACVDSHDPLEDPIPTGSDLGRLVARGLDGGGGAIIERGIFDTILEIDCITRRDAFGVDRCLPTSIGYIAFFDASCTSPVGFVQLDDGDPPAYLATAASACGAAAAVPYRVGRAITDSTPIYELIDGQCRPRAHRLTSFPTAVHEVEKIEPTYFVAVGIRDEVVTDRITSTVVRAPDGTEFVTKARDSLYGHTCGFRPVDDDYYCAPVTYAPTTHLDDTCSGDALAIASTAKRCLPASQLIYTYDSVSCGFEPKLTRVGDVVDASAEKYVQFDDRCTNSSAPFGVSEVRHLEEVDHAEVLARLGRVEIGTGRLRVITVGSSGRTFGHLGDFYDTQLNQPCWPFAFDDGFLCLPPTARTQTAYRDATCTDAVQIAFERTGSRYALHHVRDEAGADALHEVGESISPNTLYRRLYGGSCDPFEGLGPCYEWRTLGPEIDAGRYAAIRAGLLEIDAPK